MWRAIALAVTVASPVGTMTSADATTSKLSSGPLSISQMLSGWSIVNSGASGSFSGSLSEKVGPEATERASAAFANPEVLRRSQATRCH